MVRGRLSQEDADRLAQDKFSIWEACGADGRLLIDAVEETAGPIIDADAENGWTATFLARGDRCLSKARSPAKAAPEKADLYEKAALYYGLARFPATETPLKREAYSRQISALSEGSRYFPYICRRGRIPHGDRDILVNLYLPLPVKEITMPEAVLLIGDIDSTKEDLHYISAQIVTAGMACMTMDLPGTGESTWKLEPADGSETGARAIKYLAGSGEVDPSRVGVMGTGFGGYGALACAASCPEIKAVVNCGSPVHRAFSRDNLAKWPDYLKVSLAKAMGCEKDDFSKALDMLGDFSLFRRENLRRISCPVLSINGSDDPYVPIEDLFMIAEEGGVGQEEWVYREDSHCAPRQFSAWVRRSVTWIANNLGGKERIPRPDLAQL